MTIERLPPVAMQPQTSRVLFVLCSPFPSHSVFLIDAASIYKGTRNEAQSHAPLGGWQPSRIVQVQGGAGTSCSASRREDVHLYQWAALYPLLHVHPDAPLEPLLNFLEDFPPLR